MLKRITKSLENGAVLIDVREPGEYAIRHLDGSVNIPMSRLPKTIRDLAQHRHVMFYCLTGARSEIAARLARSHGIRAENLGAIDDIIKASTSCFLCRLHDKFF